MQHGRHDMFLLWTGMFAVASLLLASGIAVCSLGDRRHSLAIAILFTCCVPAAIALLTRRKPDAMETLLAWYWKACLSAALIMLGVGLARRLLS
jgi:uncharacterized membrane protein